jgi:hypothetical protein
MEIPFEVRTECNTEERKGRHISEMASVMKKNTGNGETFLSNNIKDTTLTTIEGKTIGIAPSDNIVPFVLEVVIRKFSDKVQYRNVISVLNHEGIGGN